MVTPPRCAVFAVLAALACAPPVRWVAVANTTDRSIVILSGELAAADTLRLPGPPIAVRFAADGAGLYVALAIHPGETAVAQLPRTGGVVLPSAPVAGTAVDLAVARDSRSLYLAVSGPNGGVSMMDPAALIERRRLEVCDTARALVTTGDGERLYLLCGDDRIAEIDPELEIVIRVQRLAAPCDAARLALSRTEGVIFVPCRARGQVWYLDRRTLAPFDSLTVPPGVHGIAATPNRRRVLLTLPAEARVLVADPDRRAIVSSIETPPNPTDLIVSGGVAYVLAGATVLALDPETGVVGARAVLSGAGSGLAAWPGAREPRPVWYVR